jgi:hypothetical protein
MVMSHVTFAPGDRGYALMHLFRFENGRVAELWDIAQEIPADSPNTNGPVLTCVVASRHRLATYPRRDRYGSANACRPFEICTTMYCLP